jgi:FkbM family methyltransferase
MKALLGRAARDPRLQRLARRIQMRSRRFDGLAASLPGVNCFDVGASHYPHTNWWLFLESPATRWIPVEPNADSLSYLNRWPWPAHLSEVGVGVGVSEHGGDQTLFVTNVDTGSSLLKPTIGSGMEDRVTPEMRSYMFPVTERTVPTMSLADLLVCEDEQPTLIKLDTQGSELSILRSVVHPDSTVDVVGIEMECSLLSSPLYEGSPRLWEVVEYLEPLGFELVGLDVLPRHPLRKISGRSRQIPVECDAVFARRRDLAATATSASQMALFGFYVTNNLYREAVIALRSLPAVRGSLAQAGCDIGAIAEELARRSNS